MVTDGRENQKWDKIELTLSILSIIVAIVLMIKCITGNDMFTNLYVLLIGIYPLRVVMSVMYELINLVKERSVKK